MVSRLSIECPGIATLSLKYCTKQHKFILNPDTNDMTQTIWLFTKHSLFLDQEVIIYQFQEVTDHN